MNTSIAFIPRGLRLAALCLVAGVLAGCAGLTGNKLPPAPVSASNQDYSYIVGPGDNLNIIVWRNPELSTSVPVRPDGKISTPWSMKSWPRARIRWKLPAILKSSSANMCATPW